MAGASDDIYSDTDGVVQRSSLFWLDGHVNTTDDNRKTQTCLRSIINHLQTFNNPSTCRQLIESLPQQDRLTLIVSGQFGRQLVPQIYQLQQLSSIYVYCGNKQLNEEWARQYPKVLYFF
jgi:hypothetical protein